MKKIYTIIDEEIERKNFDTETDYLKKAQLFVGNEEECRDKCCELLQDYFKSIDCHEDPVKVLLGYIPTDTLMSLMGNYEYNIKEKEKDDLYKIDIHDRNDNIVNIDLKNIVGIYQNVNNGNYLIIKFSGGDTLEIDIDTYYNIMYHIDNFGLSVSF